MPEPSLKNNSEQVIIVLPYLNEQNTLYEACYSLGFGVDVKTTPLNVSLVLVDNGSTDDSPQIAERVKAASRKASVITAHEGERGYVPPRRLGNFIAQQLAQTKGWNEREVLILQADADAEYKKAYVDSMRLAAITAGENVFLEGCLSYKPDFEATHYGYLEMCRQADSHFESLAMNEADDVVVVDCVSGYRLSDYFSWGEHRREYTLTGDEIYAESTRLYIKAKAMGGRRIRVDRAQAFHSPRKVLLDPSLHFATAGFPRERAWVEKWQNEYRGPKSLPGFYEKISDPYVKKAIRVRQQHVVALFMILPIHINFALGKCSPFQADSLFASVRSMLPVRTIDDLRITPGDLLADVFVIIE